MEVWLTHFAAKGVNIGASFYEKNMLKEAQDIIERSKDLGCEIILPIGCSSSR